MLKLIEIYNVFSPEYPINYNGNVLMYKLYFILYKCIIYKTYAYIKRINV